MNTVNYQVILTREPGKRGGRPCIRGMRITNEDISACLAFAAEREQRQLRVMSQSGA